MQKIIRSGKVKRSEVETVVTMLASGIKLGAEYNDHALRGEYDGYRECHVRGNLLLIYKIKDDVLILVVANIGSHSELFG
ncbi:MAG: Addiction module toxin [Candidatus Nomurabacteria bacterium GW2011_GWB1_37_5]|uniref:Addiction module toxin n=1 Tax=Candidatus Nomurabacteria bacterium GW2011_GWB1_37_5 TaxID=1618742 RepID=A0A0G0HBD1_9BACT|nr:MAG: Addiction module toxin [Candidatus Nomurabacteria bacterium GW2011_GWB1_37_5]